MAQITIRPAQGTWVIRAGGAVLGESSRALELAEAGREPVVYFPRADIAMAFFDLSPTATACPHKGRACHFTLHTKSAQIRGAAWSYEDPAPGLAEIRGHLAFDGDKVTVERI